MLDGPYSQAYPPEAVPPASNGMPLAENQYWSSAAAVGVRPTAV